MKITILIAQPHIVPGNLNKNLMTVLHYAALAKQANASYLFLPQYTLTGINIGTLFYQDDFQKELHSIHKILEKEIKNKFQIIFADEYDFCGCQLKINPVGISYNNKNIKVHTGGSTVCNSKGKLIAQAKYFCQDCLNLTFDTTAIEMDGEEIKVTPIDETARIYSTLKFGIQDFLLQQNIKKITVGLSGGIDSAVAAALFVDILGKNNVQLINMPSKYTSDITQKLAKNIAKNLGVKFAVVPITNVVDQTIKSIQEIGFNITTLTEENIQARDRSSRIIAAAAAAFGGAFSANGNKAELSVGYATFYGDLAGALAPLGDLWKYQVYNLGRYLNNNVYKMMVIPEAVFQIRPSAELSAEQTVGKGGDPLYYPYHDYLFNAFTKNISLTQIAKWYKDNVLEENLGCHKNMTRIIFKNNHLQFFNDLEHWWKAYHGTAVAKRLQAPPIVLVSDNPFNSFEPQISGFFSKEYLQIKNLLIKE